jgi:hypothetical protein
MDVIFFGKPSVIGAVVITPAAGKDSPASGSVMSKYICGFENWVRMCWRVIVDVLQVWCQDGPP